MNVSKAEDKTKKHETNSHHSACPNCVCYAPVLKAGQRFDDLLKKHFDEHNLQGKRKADSERAKAGLDAENQEAGSNANACENNRSAESPRSSAAV